MKRFTVSCAFCGHNAIRDNVDLRSDVNSGHQIAHADNLFP